MEFVVLVGLQASGKSTFRRAYFDNTHVVISKDNFRNNKRPTRRQTQLIAEALSAGRSVVVDNTNPSRNDRSVLLTQAKQFGAATKLFYLPSSIHDCLKRNAQREGKQRVPDVGIYSVAKVLQPPMWGEGFDEMFKVTSNGDMTFSVSLLPRNPDED